MICQHCGNCISLKDTVIVEFKGRSLPLYDFHKACYDCAINLYLDCLDRFPAHVVATRLHIYFAVTDERKVKNEGIS